MARLKWGNMHEINSKSDISNPKRGKKNILLGHHHMCCLDLHFFQTSFAKLDSLSTLLSTLVRSPVRGKYMRRQQREGNDIIVYNDISVNINKEDTQQEERSKRQI